ncbi:hypothetical protein MKX01_029960 [Papaver californicum]|nr:hypothetical protein MKX01_029960 [Papaver californicum]
MCPCSLPSEIRNLFLALQSDYEDLPEPPFRAICMKAAELEAYSRHPNSDRNEDKVRKDMHRSVDEEIRKQDQARRATILARNTAQRLLGVNKTGSKGSYGGERFFLRLGGGLLGDEETKGESVFDNKMKTDKKPMIVKLTGVTIFPKVDDEGGDTVVGTLEAHADEFIYTTYSFSFYSQLTCKYENEKKMLPLLHFQLHHPIKVGTEETKHIQFRLVLASVGKRISDNDPDKFEKEKQTSDRGRSEDLKNFVDKVEWQKPRPPFPFREASDVFVLTLSSLVHLTNTPFFVVNFQDIEIVNLARLRPLEIDMSVVFKDFSCPVLRISAIPLDSLNDIKRCLDFGVKFYDNILDLNWNSIVKEIEEKPETFVKGGGWDAYKLEDSDTSLYYRHYYLEASQADCNLKASLAVYDGTPRTSRDITGKRC